MSRVGSTLSSCSTLRRVYLTMWMPHVEPFFRYTLINHQATYSFSCRVSHLSFLSMASHLNASLGQEDIESLDNSIKMFAQRLPKDMQMVYFFSLFVENFMLTGQHRFTHVHFMRLFRQHNSTKPSFPPQLAHENA
jgi:hypothetical protein